MFGTTSSMTGGSDEGLGLYPRLVRDVLDVMQEQATQKSMLLLASGVEFYMCRGFDLLNDHVPVEISGDCEAIGAKKMVAQLYRNKSDVIDFILLLIIYCLELDI